MRYYAIRILDPDFGQVVTFNNTTNTFAITPGAPYTYGSHDPFGVLIPGALNVELDVPSLPYGAFAQGYVHVRVWGVGLPALSQAANLARQSPTLAGYNIEILAGMRPPYNLNVGAQPGTIVSGQIFQCYGNWEGLDQYLDLIIVNGSIQPDSVSNIQFTWPAGTPIATAITNALNAAFPAYTVQGQNTVSTIVTDHDESGYYSSLNAFASEITNLTANGNYTGIQITAAGSDIYLYDFSSVSSPNLVFINFDDMIGQPTWIGPTSISFSCVMRGDIEIGDLVSLPDGLYPPYVLTTEQAAFPGAPASNRSAFQGSFSIIEVHHYGNFRQADAASWRTVYVGVVNG
jgi:hypothetical protein